MKTLIATFALLGGLSVAALADDSSTPADAENACNPCAAGKDCSTLEGDAKDFCEKSRAEGDKKARDCTGLEGDQKKVCEEMAARAKASLTGEEGEPPKEEKGGKAMKKSNDGNMESYEESE